MALNFLVNHPTLLLTALLLFNEVVVFLVTAADDPSWEALSRFDPLVMGRDTLLCVSIDGVTKDVDDCDNGMVNAI
jgi:hypothetical protein